MRIGEGFDIHVLTEGRKLVLGGIEIPSEKGEYAVSDGDVLLHALIDAILGAKALGDIGKYFPPGKEYEGISSTILLEKVLEISKVEIGNIDSTVFLEEPKLGPYIDKIRENLSNLLSMNMDRISVKAKTMEALGPIGEKKAIAARVVILLKESTMEKIKTDKAPGAIGPYSQGYKVGNFVFTSGQIPVNPENGLVEEDTIEYQADRASRNVGEVLKAGGAGFDDVIKTTCFLSDMKYFAAFNEIYAKYFTSSPARSCVAVKELPKGVLCEIEAIAIVK